MSRKNKNKIHIKGLNFFYGEKQVIFDLDLKVKANGILSIIGPAGSGITTLLRSLNRLTEMNPEARMEGSILLDGKSVYDRDVRLTELRRRIGMVFDMPTPLPLSIYENIAYGPKIAGVRKKAELNEVVERALVMSALWDDVKDRLNSPGLSLSGGQQQRLCIARVLALDPDVLLLDRPCSGLDPISTAKIEDNLIQLKDRLTIIIAPHNVQQAGRVSDRVAFMLMGKLIEEGSIERMFRRPKHESTSDYITGRFG